MSGCNTRGVVVITTAWLYSTKPELRFCTGSNSTYGVSESCDGEDFWQRSRLEIRLNAFRWSTIPQKIIHHHYQHHQRYNDKNDNNDKAKGTTYSARDRSSLILPENSAVGLGFWREHRWSYVFVYENSPKKFLHLPPKSCCNFTYWLKEGHSFVHSSHIV